MNIGVDCSCTITVLQSWEGQLTWCLGVPLRQSLIVLSVPLRRRLVALGVPLRQHLVALGVPLRLLAKALAHVNSIFLILLLILIHSFSL